MTTSRTLPVLFLLVALVGTACLEPAIPSPSSSPSTATSATPSAAPSVVPSAGPSPSAASSEEPSVEPSEAPSEVPSSEPSEESSAEPSAGSSTAPSGEAGPATFWIDPKALPLDPGATEFKAFVRELSCASGKSPNGRISIKSIAYSTSKITIVVGVTPLEGPQDCQGNPAFPVTIRLSRAVGTRQILDGSANPPRDATIVPS